MSDYLSARAQVVAHPSTVCRALRRLGLPRKKRLEAAERDEQQREAFRREADVTELLVPRLRRSDVVLLDNLRVHHASSVEEAVREAKARVLWLPSYSPDFSPLENCWSKVTAIVKGKEPRAASDLDIALTEALSSVTATDVDGWFRYCGY